MASSTSLFSTSSTGVVSQTSAVSSSEISSSSSSSTSSTSFSTSASSSTKASSSSSGSSISSSISSDSSTSVVTSATSTFDQSSTLSSSSSSEVQSTTSTASSVATAPTSIFTTSSTESSSSITPTTVISSPTSSSTNEVQVTSSTNTITSSSIGGSSSSIIPTTIEVTSSSSSTITSSSMTTPSSSSSPEFSSSAVFSSSSSSSSPTSISTSISSNTDFSSSFSTTTSLTSTSAPSISSTATSMSTSSLSLSLLSTSTVVSSSVSSSSQSSTSSSSSIESSSSSLSTSSTSSSGASSSVNSSSTSSVTSTSATQATNSATSSTAASSATSGISSSTLSSQVVTMAHSTTQSILSQFTSESVTATTSGGTFSSTPVVHVATSSNVASSTNPESFLTSASISSDPARIQTTPAVITSGGSTIIVSFSTITEMTTIKGRPTQITVTIGPNGTLSPFTPDDHGNILSRSGGAVAGVVIGIVLGVGLIAFAIIFMFQRRKRARLRYLEDTGAVPGSNAGGTMRQSTGMPVSRGVMDDEFDDEIPGPGPHSALGLGGIGAFGALGAGTRYDPVDTQDTPFVGGETMSDEDASFERNGNSNIYQQVAVGSEDLVGEDPFVNQNGNIQGSPVSDMSPHALRGGAAEFSSSSPLSSHPSSFFPVVDENREALISRRAIPPSAWGVSGRLDPQTLNASEPQDQENNSSNGHGGGRLSVADPLAVATRMPSSQGHGISDHSSSENLQRPGSAGVVSSAGHDSSGSSTEKGSSKKSVEDVQGSRENFNWRSPLFSLRSRSQSRNNSKDITEQRMSPPSSPVALSSSNLSGSSTGWTGPSREDNNAPFITRSPSTLLKPPLLRPGAPNAIFNFPFPAERTQFIPPVDPSPALTTSSAGAPEGLLDPNLGMRLREGPAASSASIGLRDNEDYSRPIGGPIHNRKDSTTTFSSQYTEKTVTPG